jgi:hypothetical protein
MEAGRIQRDLKDWPPEDIRRAPEAIRMQLERARQARLWGESERAVQIYTLANRMFEGLLAWSAEQQR